MAPASGEAAQREQVTSAEIHWILPRDSARAAATAASACVEYVERLVHVRVGVGERHVDLVHGLHDPAPQALLG